VEVDLVLGGLCFVGGELDSAEESFLGLDDFVVGFPGHRDEVGGRCGGAVLTASGGAPGLGEFFPHLLEVCDRRPVEFHTGGEGRAQSEAQLVPQARAEDCLGHLIGHALDELGGGDEGFRYR
jgi:hypothetical protein